MNAKRTARWAILIQRIYHADPLICPKCGGTMKIISFIEARQTDVLRKILQHCGLWHPPHPPDPHPPPRSPPDFSRPSRAKARPAAANSQEIDPDFLEHLHREAQQQQIDLSWE